MKRMFCAASCALLTLILAGAAAAAEAAADDEEGFVPLFNEKDTEGWHLRRPDGHNSWTVEDGILKNTVGEGEHGTDLVTDKKYWNFVVRYEYMVPEGSNSGFYLRGRHELQILGDYEVGRTARGGNGAIYNFKKPDKFASKPGDEWQTVEATMIGDKITVVLNGETIHDNVACDKATGSELDDKVGEPGAFFLQGDHGTVAFRKLRVKELK
jgi:hypothetical protein